MVSSKTKRRIVPVCLLIAALAIVAIVLSLPTAQQPREIDARELAVREHFLDTARQWLGCNESDGSHCAIIDLYNSHEPLARDYLVQYDDAWCATFVSAVAIELGWTDIIPTECGCQRQIALFQDLGRWEEDDDFCPVPGDIIYYASKSSSSKENTGWADHVGIVVSVSGKTITTIEGNYNDSVSYRSVCIGDSSIRGYALPDYAEKIPQE